MTFGCTGATEHRSWLFPQKNGTNSETISRTYAAGTYYVRVYGNKNANNATSCYTLRIALGTAAKTTGQEKTATGQKMTLHPNAANQVLHVAVDDYSDEKTIEVFDLMGRVVMKESTRQRDATLRTGSLPAGLYTVKISAKDGRFLSQDKFVKE